MDTIKALALGDYTDVKYHPFTAVDKEIESIFQDKIQVTSTEDYSLLSKEGLKNYKLFISYTEFNDEALPADRTAALLSFVAEGGGIVAIHNGISLQKNHELASMLGARFTGHPPFRTLSIQLNKSVKHPIVNELDDFIIDDEPYLFEMDSHLDTTILAYYEHDGEMKPAAWAHSFGLGRVVYLMPGHQLSSFHVEEYRELILRSGLWATNSL